MAAPAREATRSVARVIDSLILVLVSWTDRLFMARWSSPRSLVKPVAVCGRV